MGLPVDYAPALNVRQTQIAIKQLKDFFERELSHALNLTRVSAPLFVRPETGLNDNLNGVERPVAFDLGEDGSVLEIVQSLAKWKREALFRYGFGPGEGLYTDMNAIRRDETADYLHSIYVDQWDWERTITRSERTMQGLIRYVRAIYRVFLRTQSYIQGLYPGLSVRLPEEITFITTQELENRYPALSPKEREHEIVRKFGAVFLMQIGDLLASGQKHDGRAPDYDDWALNGDIIFYNPLYDEAIELSSMGIRVDAQSLREQLQKANCMSRAELPFQKKLLEDMLPLSIGGGIGQSRLCMFFLQKAHIGEVQCSVWPKDMLDECAKMGVPML